MGRPSLQLNSLLREELLRFSTKKVHAESSCSKLHDSEAFIAIKNGNLSMKENLVMTSAHSRKYV